MLVSIAGAVLVMRTGAARADHSSADADRHLHRGLEHFQHRDYQRAIREFHAGYAIAPRREFLFALAQAERLSGDCRSAIIYYRQFLSRNPPQRQATAAFEQIEHCQKALAEGPGAVERPAPAPTPRPAVQQPVAPPVVAAAPARRHWYADGPGDALFGGGIALAAGSVVMLLSANVAAADARSASTYPQFDQRSAAVTTRRRLAIGFAIAGALALSGATYRFVTRGGAERERRIALVPTDGGAAVAIGGRF